MKAYINLSGALKLAINKEEAGVRTHVALKVLNLKGRSRPAPPLDRCHLPLSTSSVAARTISVLSGLSDIARSDCPSLASPVLENALPEARAVSGVASRRESSIVWDMHLMALSFWAKFANRDSRRIRSRGMPRHATKDVFLRTRPFRNQDRKSNYHINTRYTCHTRCTLRLKHVRA